MRANPFAIAVAGIAALGVATWAVTRPGHDMSDCAATRVMGQAAIGGPFELESETGETVTDAEVFTRPSIVYFGYTHCPDVCPIDNMRNVQAVELLAEQGIEAQAVFITVDPARDTPEVMADYTAMFEADPEAETLIGLTGTEEQIQEAKRAWRVSAQLGDTSDEFYLVSHTTFSYLVLPGQGVVEIFNRDTPVEDMAATVACYIRAAV